MITAEQLAVEDPSRSRPDRTLRSVPSPQQGTVPGTEERSVLWRVVLMAAGFAIAFLGWALVMTVVLSYIGLPLLIVGAALVQAQQGP